MPKKKTTLPNTPGRQRAQAKYNAKPEQKKRRAERNAARRAMEKAGKVRKGDGKDVDHIHRSARGSLSNKKSNLRVTSASKNRARNFR